MIFKNMVDTSYKICSLFYIYIYIYSGKKTNVRQNDFVIIHYKNV